jgi:hypothetical protein
MRRLVKLLQPKRRRRLGATVTLVAYLATAFGVPMPANGGAAAACGCASVEVCDGGSCCCSSHKPASRHSGCCSRSVHRPMSCCQHHTSTQADAPEQDETTSGVRWVTGIAAMKCRGHSTLWVATGVLLPVPAPDAAESPLAPTGWALLPDARAISTLRIPPDPPPRTA